MLFPPSEAEHRALQQRMALSALGSIGGAVLWKSHRVWGFIFGWIGGGAIGDLVFLGY